MKAWEEVAEEPLSFPIGGKTYVIPELGYQAMLTIQKVRAGLPSDLDDVSAENSWRLVMGPAWDEMVKDDVSAEAIARAGLATLAYFEQGRAIAEMIWEYGIDPKALTEGIRVRAEQNSQPSTGSATPTPSRDSSRPTTSRKASSRKPPKDSRSSSSASSGR